MTETEIAWLAGWLEGEGCFSMGGSTPKIHVVNTDLDVVEKASRLMNGKVVKCKMTNPKLKQQYRIVIYGIKAVIIMKEILPFMGQRRIEAIEKALDYFNGKAERRAIANKKMSKIMSKIMKAKMGICTIKGWETKKLNGWVPPRDNQGRFISTSWKINNNVLGSNQEHVFSSREDG